MFYEVGNIFSMFVAHTMCSNSNPVNKPVYNNSTGYLFNRGFGRLCPDFFRPRGFLVKKKGVLTFSCPGMNFLPEPVVITSSHWLTCVT